MPKRVFADINPDVLRWARKTRGWEVDFAANKIGVSHETLAACEKGEDQLSVPQLRRAANFYKRPVAIFYLSTVPEALAPVRDFRRLPESMGNPLSPEFLLEIRRVHQKREAAVDLAEFGAEYDWGFVRTIDSHQNPEEVGGFVREILGITDEVQEGWANQYQAFGGWRSSIENIGVFAFLISGIRVTEMRGFSIVRGSYPVIAVNRKDSPKPRSFTLLHEFCHVLIGESGICDMTERDYRNTDKSFQTEVFCNHVAGAALVPAETLLEHPLVRKHREEEEWENSELQVLSRYFHASQEVILRRLLILKLTSSHFYEEWREARRDRPSAAPQGTPMERGFQRVLRTQGASYVRLVLEALHSDSITAADASDYLDMKLRHLADLEKAL